MNKKSTSKKAAKKGAKKAISKASTASGISLADLHFAIATNKTTIHQVIASSFADPADVAAFNHCKAEGHSDQFCFKLGDNGIGFMGDDCTTSTPMCALPVEDWIARWGNKTTARLKPVIVTANGKTVVCLMGDTMPKKANITNGAGIDLSPAAVKAIGKKPPLMIAATWSWQDDEP